MSSAFWRSFCSIVGLSGSGGRRPEEDGHIHIGVERRHLLGDGLARDVHAPVDVQPGHVGRARRGGRRSTGPDGSHQSERACLPSVASGDDVSTASGCKTLRSGEPRGRGFGSRRAHDSFHREKGPLTRPLSREQDHRRRRRIRAGRFGSRAGRRRWGSFGDVATCFKEPPDANPRQCSQGHPCHTEGGMYDTARSVEDHSP